MWSYSTQLATTTNVFESNLPMSKLLYKKLRFFKKDSQAINKLSNLGDSVKIIFWMPLSAMMGRS